MARALLSMLCCLPLLASAAADPRVPFLEQELRRLHGEVRALARRVDELGNRPARPATGASPADKTAPAGSDTWIDAGKWRQLRPGMSELEVVSALGTPTSMREQDGDRVLLYALEIGASGFLGGSVRLRDRAVVEVREPTLQ
jgi:hypothetical protein